jgi:hypothetical protein
MPTEFHHLIPRGNILLHYLCCTCWNQLCHLPHSFRKHDQQHGHEWEWDVLQLKTRILAAVLTVSGLLGALLTYATAFLSNTSTTFYSGGHPAGIYIAYGYPLPLHNETYLDAFVGTYGTQFYYLDILADFLLFFMTSIAVLIVLVQLSRSIRHLSSERKHG